MASALRLQGVSKAFGAQQAVSNLDFEVPSGQTCGLIGPSGAGKTTTIRIIMSILFPDSGQVAVLGNDSALAAKNRIGYLPEERGVYRKMRVGAFLRYLAALKGMAEADAASRCATLLQKLGLDDVEKKRCEDLSKGMLQRVQVVGALVHRPELLILDEPFSGLDPVSVRLLKTLLQEERQRGMTMLFSTHVMAQAEELCDRVVMIHKGRKVLDEPTAAMRRRFDLTRLLFEPLDASANLAALRQIQGVQSISDQAGTVTLRLTPGTDPAAVMREISSHVPPARLEIARLRLEDVFVDIVHGTAGATGGADSEQALRQHLQGLGV